VCKLFYLAASDSGLIDAFRLFISEWKPGGSRDAGPGDDVPVILNDAPDTLTSARWGLVPATAATDGFGRQLVNARSDSLTERPSYRSAFRSRHCLILVDGFYERGRQPDGSRALVRFSLASGGPMALAGLWEIWDPPVGDPLRTCTMITVPANAFVGRVHGRMPCVLGPDEQQAWLSCEDPADAAALLKPCPEDMLESCVLPLDGGPPCPPFG